jgi:hypothetical protein
MKIKLIGGDNLTEGLNILLPELDAALCTRCADLTVTVTECEEDILRVTLNGKEATLTYGGGKARAYRGFAKLIAWKKAGKTAASAEEKPLFETNGAMADVSRCNVLKLDTIKYMMRKMALMGMNQFMIYAEDVFEVEGYPYFGYLRGRYSVAELKELDAYALALGIELVPCIQLLGHLSAHMKWDAAAPYRDTASAMLVGADTTYALIAKILDTVKETFSTKKIHIGMDETHDLGTGKALDKYGYIPREELYFQHLARIAPMLRERGFEPMMWSDMFFRLAGKHIPDFWDFDDRVSLPEDIGEKACGIRPVFWDYYCNFQSHYDKALSEHKKFGTATMFAGGVWLWSGFAPIFSHSLGNTLPALLACKKAGTREVLATIWNNGSESALVHSLAGLAWYADFDYIGEYNEDSVKACFKNATGLCYEDLMLLEGLEHPTKETFCATRGLLYNDPLLGLADAHLGNAEGFAAHYAALAEKIAEIADRQGFMAPSFKTLAALASALENKADFGLRLTKAYKENDREALAALLKECDVLIEKLRALQEAHRISFHTYNRPFGFELHDARYGGLISRFATAKMRIADYLSGKIEKMEELEQERLPLRGKAGEIGRSFTWLHYKTFANPNFLS